jgi:hypothetical protein
MTVVKCFERDSIENLSAVIGGFIAELERCAFLDRQIVTLIILSTHLASLGIDSAGNRVLRYSALLIYKLTNNA